MTRPLETQVAFWNDFLKRIASPIQNISQLFSFWLFIHFDEMVGGIKALVFLIRLAAAFSLSLLYSLFSFSLFIGTHTQLFRHHQTYTHS
jgi:hypothetical protein